MSRFIENFKKKFGWSFIGVVLALIFGAFTIYTVFIEDKLPKLKYEILTNTSILDVKEELSGLNILYENIDIQKQGLSLRVIHVRVVNNSSKDILKSYYDEKDPLGCSVSIGKIIKKELIRTSNTYLKKNLKLKIDGDRNLLFSTVIIEANESFNFKLLVLHPRNKLPNISHIGKVAGIKSIPIIETRENEEKIPFMKKIFFGNFYIQIIRLISYTILALGIIILILISYEDIHEKYLKFQREKNVMKFKNSTKISLNMSDEFIFEEYSKKGYPHLQVIKSIISNPKNLARELHLLKISEKPLSHPPKDEEFFKHGILYLEQSRRSLVEKLEYQNLIIKTKSGPRINNHFKTTLNKFINFLSEIDMISRKTK